VVWALELWETYKDGDMDGGHMSWSRRAGTVRYHATRVLLGCVIVASSLTVAAVAQADEAHETVQFGCQGVTFSFAGFPDAQANTVNEAITIDRTTKVTRSFSFDGPSATNTVPLELTPGHHRLDAWVQWKTNGVKGGHDQPLAHGIDCGAASLKIVKLQALGKKGQFTTSRLFGTRREHVRYEIVVENTGGVPLKLGALTDPRCDAGTITGGPGQTPLQPGESTTYTCTHELTPADQAFGTYENVASITATPPEGDGPPITELSDPVLIELPHDAVEATCEAITFTFANFPDAPGNTVSELVTVDGETRIATSFVFDGPNGSNTIALQLSPGHHKVDAWVKWKTNGAKGGHDETLKGGVRCTQSA
jgi:hypothetical protein